MTDFKLNEILAQNIKDGIITWEKLTPEHTKSFLDALGNVVGQNNITKDNPASFKDAIKAKSNAELQQVAAVIATFSEDELENGLGIEKKYKSEIAALGKATSAAPVPATNPMLDEIRKLTNGSMVADAITSHFHLKKETEITKDELLTYAKENKSAVQSYIEGLPANEKGLPVIKELQASLQAAGSDPVKPTLPDSVKPAATPEIKPAASAPTAPTSSQTTGSAGEQFRKEEAARIRELANKNGSLIYSQPESPLQFGVASMSVNGASLQLGSNLGDKRKFESFTPLSKALPNTLILRNTNFSDNDFVHISNKPSLTEIDLAQTEVTVKATNDFLAKKDSVVARVSMSAETLGKEPAEAAKLLTNPKIALTILDGKKDYSYDRSTKKWVAHTDAGNNMNGNSREANPTLPDSLKKVDDALKHLGTAGSDPVKPTLPDPVKPAATPEVKPAASAPTVPAPTKPEVKPAASAPTVPDPAKTPSSQEHLEGFNKAGNNNRAFSPYPPYNELNISGLAEDSLALDPTTQKVFKVPSKSKTGFNNPEEVKAFVESQQKGGAADKTPAGTAGSPAPTQAPTPANAPAGTAGSPAPTQHYSIEGDIIELQEGFDAKDIEALKTDEAAKKVTGCKGKGLAEASTLIEKYNAENPNSRILTGAFRSSEPAASQGAPNQGTQPITQNLIDTPLSADKLKRAVATMPKEILDKMFGEMDTNKDKKVSADEIISAVHNMYKKDGKTLPTELSDPKQIDKFKAEYGEPKDRAFFDKFATEALAKTNEIIDSASKDGKVTIRDLATAADKKTQDHKKLATATHHDDAHEKVTCIGVGAKGKRTDAVKDLIGKAGLEVSAKGTPLTDDDLRAVQTSFPRAVERQDDGHDRINPKILQQEVSGGAKAHAAASGLRTNGVTSSPSQDHSNHGLVRLTDAQIRALGAQGMRALYEVDGKGLINKHDGEINQSEQKKVADTLESLGVRLDPNARYELPSVQYAERVLNADKSKSHN